MKYGHLACSAAFAFWLATPVAIAAEIKVGAAGGFTGPVAEIAAGVHSARELAVKQINEQGGLLKGDQMRLATADSGCDPKAGVDAANKLVNVEQVVSIIGPTCSGESISMAQTVTIPAGVLLMPDSATSPAITELPDNDTVFRTVASDSDQGNALTRLVKEAGINDVAMIVANDDYNVGIAKVFQREFEAAGGKISASQTVEPQKASYRSDLATLSGAGSRTLMVFLYYNTGGITVLKNSLEGGLFDKFYGAGGMPNQAVVDQIGADNLRDRLFLATPSADVDDPSYKLFADAARAASINPDEPYLANGYDATFLTALAIEKAGSADRKLLPAALREISGPEGEIIRPGEWEKAKKLIAEGKKINYEGASGNVDFDKNGDVRGTFGVNIVSPAGKLVKGSLIR